MPPAARSGWAGGGRWWDGASDQPTPASLLYVPASNHRAVGKVSARGAETVILDLEDGAAPGDRPEARDSLAGWLAPGTGELAALAAQHRLWLRVNRDGADADADLAAIRSADPTGLVGLVVPKVGSPACLAACQTTGRPLLAMIETPVGVLGCAEIARVPGVVGLIAGLNDLAHALKLPAGAMRTGTTTALSLMVLAARAAGIAVFDGVWNDFGDVEGFTADTSVGRALGCDGRTLIHPSQVVPCHAVYWPDDASIAEALALVVESGAATAGGARRQGDAMVEDMHIDAARALLSTAAARGLYHPG